MDHYDRVGPGEAFERTREGRAVLLDVREDAEFAAGHAPGAVPLPLSRITAGVDLPPGVGGRQVLAICRSGHRSQKAVALLAGRGHDVADVIGGMREWQRAGLPVHIGEGAGGQVI